MDRNKRITVPVYDRMATFEFSIPVEVFALPRPCLDPWYDFEVCGLESGPLRATGGIAISVEGGAAPSSGGSRTATASRRVPG